MFDPPAIYQYRGPLTELTDTRDRVEQLCRASGVKADGPIYGCAIKGRFGCHVIYSVGGVSGPLSEAIRRFEIAHCAGMPEHRASCRLCRYLRTLTTGDLLP